MLIQNYFKKYLFLFCIFISTSSIAENKLHYVGIAGYDHYVFDHEIREVKNILYRNYKLDDLIHLLSNYDNYIDAEKFDLLFETLRTKIPKNDVVLFYITSHGIKEGAVAFQKNENLYAKIFPRDLKKYIDSAQLKNVILIISTCYSGSFKKIANNNILVITASNSDKTSYGCKPDNDWTFFGRAFFVESLSKNKNFIKAFESARKIIKKWETEGELIPSEPQISGGKSVIKMLNNINKQEN